MIIKDGKVLTNKLAEIVYDKEKFAKFMNFINKKEYQGLKLGSLIQIYLDYKEASDFKKEDISNRISLYISKEEIEKVAKTYKDNGVELNYKLENLSTSKYYDYGTKEEKVLYDVIELVGNRETKVNNDILLKPKDEMEYIKNKIEQNYKILNDIIENKDTYALNIALKQGLEVTPVFKRMLYDRYDYLIYAKVMNQLKDLDDSKRLYNYEANFFIEDFFPYDLHRFKRKTHNTEKYCLESNYWDNCIKNKNLMEIFEHLNKVIEVKNEQYSNIDNYLEQKNKEVGVKEELDKSEILYYTTNEDKKQDTKIEMNSKNSEMEEKDNDYNSSKGYGKEDSSNQNEEGINREIGGGDEEHRNIRRYENAIYGGLSEEVSEKSDREQVGDRSSEGVERSGVGYESNGISRDGTGSQVSSILSELDAEKERRDTGEFDTTISNKTQNEERGLGQYDNRGFEPHSSGISDGVSSNGILEDEKRKRVEFSYRNEDVREIEYSTIEKITNNIEAIKLVKQLD